MVAVPTVVEATGRVTHKVPGSGFPAQPGENHCQSSNVAAQNAVASVPQSLHHSGISPAPVVANPQLAELVTVSSLPITLNVMVPSASAVSGSNTSESALIQQLQAEVLRLSNALQVATAAASTDATTTTNLGEPTASGSGFSKTQSFS